MCAARPCLLWENTLTDHDTPRSRPTQVDPGSATRARTPGGALQNLRRVFYLVASLYLFVFALMLMKDGARGLEPLIKDLLDVNGVVNSVGFGWLFSYAVLSGSPVAAAALALLDSGVLTAFEAFGMITGSRLGASFIVLALGFLYALRGHERSTSLSMGVLALIVTGSTQMLALPVGIGMLYWDLTPPWQLGGGARVMAITDLLVGGIASTVAAQADALGGAALVFVAGLGVIMLSFGLFDRGLPPLGLETTPVGEVSRVLYRPIVMLALGALVTLISMSVSVSLSLLVPLSARGYVRRENVIPYIMGANITTFIDTLLAAVVMTEPMGFTVVLTQMIAILAVSLAVLTLALRRYEQRMLQLVEWTTADNRHVVVFIAAICILPILMLVF